MLFTKNNVSYKAALVSISAFDPEGALALGMPANSITTENDNIDNVIAYIQANRVFERMAGFKNAKLSESFENEVVDEVDDCDIGERQKTSDIIPSFEGDWLTTLDLSALKILLGFDFMSVPGVLVNNHVQTRTSGAWGYETNKRLEFQHHSAGGAIIAPVTVTSVTGTVDGALTVDVDYRIVDNGFGEFGIEFYAGVNITTLVQDIAIDYDYLPIAANYTGYTIGQVIQPYFIVEIITCPDENGKSDTYYIVKANLSWALDTNFVASGEVPLSSVTLTGSKGGRLLKERTRI